MSFLEILYIVLYIPAIFTVMIIQNNNPCNYSTSQGTCIDEYLDYNTTRTCFASYKGTCIDDYTDEELSVIFD